LRRFSSASMAMRCSCSCKDRADAYDRVYSYC
jgi:hypothetical protein